MKVKSERDKRNFIIIALCVILVVMGVGYAVFSSMLTINGTANITNSWCVGFDNTKTDTMEITKGLSAGENTNGTMTYSGTACGSTLQPNASLTATFHQPGDQIEYTLTIVNKSSVTAAIKSITINNDENVTSNWTHTDGNITYTVEMPVKTTLVSNETTTMKVIMKFQNDTPIGSGYTGESHSINVRINTEQDDGNGGITPTASKFTGSIYRWNTTAAQNGQSIATVSGTKWCAESSEFGNSCDFGMYWESENECNQFLTDNSMEATCGQKTGTFGGIGDYTTDASALNKTYYLKHDVADDIITASYVCFVYNNAEHCMKGGDNGASFAANTQTIKDFQTFNNLPDNANPGCYFNSSYSYCIGGGFDQVSASSNGSMSVHDSSSESCLIDFDGYSKCN